MKARLIALDLDGTTLHSDKTLSLRTKSAIEQACGTGAIVLPATGRPRVGLPAEVLSVNGIRYAITSNGGSIYDLSSQHELFVRPIDKSAALWALQQATALHAITDVYMKGEAYSAAGTFERQVSIVPSELKAYFLSTRTLVPNQRQWLADTNGAVEKLTLIFSNADDQKKAWRFFESCGYFEVASSIENNLELNQKGVNKGTSLLKLAEHLRIPQHQIMACGDSYNDIPMIRAAGIGVAVSNAAPSVLDAADIVAAGNDDDGVAKVIEQYAL